MLLGDADVEAALRERLAEGIEAGARRHRGIDRDDAVIGLGFGDQRLGEHAGIARRLRRRFLLRAGCDVEFHHAVILVGGGFGRAIALALLRHAMDQHRTRLVRIGEVLQNGEQMLQIVAVDRADVIEAQLLEQGAAAGDDAAREFLGLLGRALERPRQDLRDILRHVAQRAERGRRQRAGEIGAERADRRGDRHVVVVEDDDEARIARAGIVHCLVRHARAHRAVADDRDHIALAAQQLARHRHAEAGGNRGRAVRGAERVVFRFRALGETAEAATLADGADAVAPAGHDLVRIGLMTDIPDQPVVRRVEYVVNRDSQFDHAETRAEMAAGHGNRIDRLLPQFVGDLTQLTWVKLTQVGRCLDAVQERRLAGSGHDDAFSLFVRGCPQRPRNDLGRESAAYREVSRQKLA